VGWGLVVGGVLVDFGSPFVSSPATAAVVLVIPLLTFGLVLAFPDLFEDQDRSGKGVSLFLVGPAFFVGAPLIGRYVEILGPLPIAGCVAIAAIGALASLSVAIRRRRRLLGPTRLVVVMTIIAALYGWFAPSVANVAFDFSPGRTTRVTVLGKHEVAGNRGGDTDYLDLPAWGPVAEPGPVDAGPWIYSHIGRGDTVCMVVHPGALRQVWYQATLCPGTPA